MKTKVWKGNFLFKIPFLMVFVLVLVLSAFTTSNASGVPLIYINTVQKDISVTISGANFPAGQDFTVRMGAYGTMGIGGVVVGTKTAAAGSSFTAIYTIPASLVGASKIAIRFDSAQGYFSYNWFYNQPAPVVTPVVPGYVGIPTFNITSVVEGVSVTILTNNFPALQTYTVKMGEFGTLGVGGTVVGTTDSGVGGSFSKTYTIPAALATRDRIAIRLEGPLGFYAYNWFFNNSTGVVSPTTTPIPVVPGYVGIPTFSIASVVKDASVTISAYNFPPGQTFTVRMGEYGTYAIGGTAVTTVNSGSGGSFSATYTIPASLAGRSKIAIRLETSSGYYYAFNWFYNN